MKNYNAVLFDLDGTLVDSVHQLTCGINALMQSLRLRPFTKEEISRMIGKGVRVLLSKVCDARGVFATEQTLDFLQKRYEFFVSQLDPEIAPFFPGAIESVRTIRKMGIYTVLVTNKSRTMTNDFLEKHDIASLFDFVITADDVEHPKPSGDMIRLAYKKLYCERTSVLMIGDSRNDALAARNAGAEIVLVETGYNEGEPIAQWARENGFVNVQKDVASVLKWLMKQLPDCRLELAGLK